MNDSNENFYLTTAPIKKLLLKFSIPCVLAMLVSALYNIVDQIFIGNSTAGTAGIMATTLVFPFTVIALAIAQLIGDGCATLFSISLGAKDEKTSNKCVGNAIIAVIVLSVILVALGFIFIKPIFRILGVNGYDERCILFTEQYYKIILCGVPFYMFASSMASIIRASGAPTYSMISTIVGAIINLIFDPILIFGFNMGVKGAAIATISGQIVSAILCAIYFRKPKLMKLTKDSFKIEKTVLGKILKLGISSFITQASIAIITIVANNVVGNIGGENATDAGGALGIVFKIFAIVLAFSLGVAVGGQPIIGYNYGAKQYKRVLETYKFILIANIIIGAISMLLFEFAPSFIVSLFGGHANNLEFYKEYACLSFRIYLGGILFCCIQKASCIYLQSIDKPFKATILSLMRDVIILVPGVCILGLCGNLYTMLWAGPIADIGAFIVTVIFVTIECKKISKLAKEEVIIEENKEAKAKSTINIKEKFVISIGREFGSGGKYIGQELAKRLNIKCYDDELLNKVATDYNIDKEMLEKVDEKQKSSFWYGFATNYVFSNNDEVSPISADDNIFLKQAKVIEDLYDAKESAIIVGRCSDYILRDKVNVIKLFIYSSDMDFKINRKAQYENLNKTIAEKKIRQKDKERAEYYKHFTSQTWGDRDNYDLCIDTSKLGIDETIDVLENYISKRVK
jgi:putative MATE family efflux protein